MLTVKCQSCGAVYKLAEDLYTRKAAGFGVVVTCRRCKTEIHVEAGGGSAGATPEDQAAGQELETIGAEPAPPPEPAAAPAPAAAKPAPAAPRATPKATAPWPEAKIASPAAPAVAPAGSPKPPAAAPGPGFPRPRPPTPPGPKVIARKDPVSGPFVALSPGLLGGARPEPIPDSEVPVDSSDFLDDRKKGASPKAPPVRRPLEPKLEMKEPPKGGMQLKLKEPPAPPKQKPRAPMRSDDVSDDLLSADVGFEGLPPAAEAPKLLAPDALLLAAPPPESKPPAAPAAAQATKEPSPAASEAKKREAAPAKSSRWIPIALLSMGAVGAFAMAFRSQLKDGAPPKPEPAPVEQTKAASPPPPPNVVPPMPAPIEPPGATETASAAAPAAPAPSATATSVSPSATTTRVTSASTSKTGPAPASTAASSAGPKPGSTAPAPGATEAPAEPRAAAEGPFNADAARTALAAAVSQASSCRKPGDPSGVAAVTITFSPSGRVTSANIAGPPFAGTPTGGCIAATLRRARVPAFTGDMVTVRKTVEIQ